MCIFGFLFLWPAYHSAHPTGLTSPSFGVWVQSAMNFFFPPLLLLETLGAGPRQEPLTQSGSLFWITQKSLDTDVLAEGHAWTRSSSIMCCFKKKIKKSRISPICFVCLWHYFHYQAGLFRQERPTLHLLSISYMWPSRQRGDVKKKKSPTSASLPFGFGCVSHQSQRSSASSSKQRADPESGGRFKHFQIPDDKFIFAASNRRAPHLTFGPHERSADVADLLRPLLVFQ